MTLVSNTEQSEDATKSINSFDQAQAFTTGTSNTGFKLTALRIRLAEGSGSGSGSDLQRQTLY